MPRSRPPQAGEINSELPFVRHRYILGEAERDRPGGNGLSLTPQAVWTGSWACTCAAYDLIVVPSAA